MEGISRTTRVEASLFEGENLPRKFGVHRRRPAARGKAAYGMDVWQGGGHGGLASRTIDRRGRGGARAYCFVWGQFCVYIPPAGLITESVPSLVSLSLLQQSAVHCEEVPTESINLELASRENRSAKCEWYVGVLCGGVDVI